MTKVRLLILLVVACLTLTGIAASAAGQIRLDDYEVAAQEGPGTDFTFQGGLSNVAGPVTGACDFRFGLFGAASGGGQVGATLTRSSVQLSNGLFAVELDFGDVFTGDPRWLEVGVRCPAGSGAYATLSPRQAIAPTPYALTASRAQGSQGNFLAAGDLWSTAMPHDGVGGAVVLENAASRNRWTMPIRADKDDTLEFDFWDAVAGTWRFGASLDRHSNLTLQGTIRAQYLLVHGDVVSSRASDGINAGAIVLENTTTGNKWDIPVRASNNDNLEFHFFDGSRRSWRRVASLGPDGDLTLGAWSSDAISLLQLEHPDAQWHFHVDSFGHPEMAVGKNPQGAIIWNTLDIDPANGHIGIGADATANEHLKVYGDLATTGSARFTNLAVVAKTDPSSGTMLRLSHPKTEMNLHVDASGHPEIGIYGASTGLTRWNALDFDPATGHVGIGGDATSGENLKVYGNFSATGTKASTVQTQSFGERKLYAVEAADVRFSDEGLAQLHDGVARIDLDPVFAETIEEPYIITVTPYGNASLFVEDIGEDFFVVKAREGDGQVTFAWRLSAKRKGYGEVRLEHPGSDDVGHRQEAKK